MANRGVILSSVLVLSLLIGCQSQPDTTPSARPLETAVAPSTDRLGASPSVTPGVSTTATAELSATQTPAPPLMADVRFGAAFFSPMLTDPNLPCDLIRTIGVGSSFFGAWRGLIEPQPGRYEWSSVDTVVDAAIRCGMAPVIKITTASGPGQDGAPPQDMQAYSQFVFNLAQHLKGRAHAYAIENEVNNPRAVWTAETYGPLRAAAYQAIKQADPGATVLDGGLTMDAYLAAWASQLQLAGQTAQALDMLARFEGTIRRRQRDLPDTEAQLKSWLSRPQTQRSLALVDELHSHPQTFDAVQLHYLQDAWELVPEYVALVRDLLAGTGTPDKPIEFWEIGYGWEGEQYSEQDHANGVVKTLVSALGEGAARAIYEPYSEGSGNPGRGLVPRTGPRLAATAYQTLTTQLKGYTLAERLDLGSGVWAYRFARPRGTVYVVWAQDSVTVRVPLQAARVTVTDVTGATSQGDPASLPVGSTPLFVQAGGAAP